MMSAFASDAPISDADAFAEEVIVAGAAVRLAALLAAPPAGALYHVPDRGGVAVVAVPGTSLTSEEAAALLRFRFAQYLGIGFVDRGQACARGMRTEPPTAMAPGDVHVVAGAAATGEILSYAVIEQPPSAPVAGRLRSAGRELFSVEQVHGAGVFNRLPILPDLAAGKIRELGRFVRNRRSVAGRELAARAVVETGVAIFRLLAGPLRHEVDAIVGDLEEHVAKQNLDYFHIPSVVVHGTVPYTGRASYLSPRYGLHAVYPFACLTSDISTALPRLLAVEQALSQPGTAGLLALLQLRSRGAAAPSMLRPRDDNDPAGELSLPQIQTSMNARGLLLEQGARLREMTAFAGLSVAEAALLATLLQRVTVPAGQVITRQGDAAEALYIVESGEATVELADGAGEGRPVGSVSPGQCCGHVAVLDGAENPADVVARTDMTLLRLSKAAHDTYLARLPEVGELLRRDALRRLAEIDRHRRTRAATPPADGGCGESCACAGHDHAPARDSGGVRPTVTASRR
jgi:CRP-like cAMP-binding protein